MTTLSVLMPSYNSAQFLDSALDCVLGAIGTGDELVIQDGASTDGTRELVEERATRDSRVKLVSEPDTGQSDALNRALARCNGDFILWMNADDLVNSDALAEARSRIASDPSIDLVIGGHQIVNSVGSVLATYRAEPLSHRGLMLRGCYVFSGSMLIRTEILRSVGGFSNEFHYCMDLDLMFRLAERTGGEAIAGPIGVLRWHDGSKSGGSGSKFVADAWRARRKHRRGPTDSVASLFAAAVQMLSLATVRLRHTDFYRGMRLRVRRGVS